VVSYGKGLGVDIETFVSNYEGAILEFVHQSAERAGWAEMITWSGS
jgi:3-dehydroquinate dehydratase II